MSCKSKFITFVTLISLASLNFGNYYIQDIPQELAGNFLTFFNKTPADVEFLYTLYSTPATIMAVVSGFVISWLTPTLTAVIAAYMMFFSAALSMLGTHTHEYKWILIGRFIYGLFGEPIQITQNTLIAEVFDGKSLSLAVGLGQVTSNLGLSASNYLTGKVWLSSRNISVPFFFGAISCMISVLSSFTWAFIDIFGYKKFLDSESENDNSSTEPLKEDNESALAMSDKEEEGTHSHGGKIDFSMIKDLKDPVIIILIILLMLSNQSYYLFTSMSTECLIKRFGLSLIEAKDRLFILPLLSTPMIPVYSGLLVRFGKKPLLFIIGYILCIGSYVLMSFLPAVEGSGDEQTHTSTKNLLYISIVLLSQFNAIRGSLVYSCIALASPTVSLPLAFGIGLFSSNLMGAIMPNILGRVIKADTHEAFQHGIWCIGLVACLGLAMSIFLWITDKSQGGLLWFPENGPKARYLKKKINQRAIERQNAQNKSMILS